MGLLNAPVPHVLGSEQMAEQFKSPVGNPGRLLHYVKESTRRPLIILKESIEIALRIGVWRGHGMLTVWGRRRWKSQDCTLPASSQY